MTIQIALFIMLVDTCFHKLPGEKGVFSDALYTLY